MNSVKRTILGNFALISALVLTFSGCSGKQTNSSLPPLQFDKYGGLNNISGNNTTGFFRTQLINNRWLFVDPDNHPFFSLGVNHVSFSSDGAQFLGYSEYNNNLLSLFPSYFSQYAAAQWAQEVINRCKELGFNTLGAWSDNGLTTFQDAIPYTVILGFASSVEGGFGADNCPSVSSGFSSNFPDVYDPRFQKDAYAYAQQSISTGSIDDPWLIGYFVDNELSWFGGAQLIYNPNYTLADDFIALPSTYAGKQYWVNTFLQQKLGYTLDTLNQLYGTAFTKWTDLLNRTKLPNNKTYPQIQTDKNAFLYDIASTYFSVTNSALKSVDPNHLNLCARFASYAPDQVISAAANYCDAISVNDYFALSNPESNGLLGDPVTRWYNMLASSTINNKDGRPFIQSEFSMRGDDAGLPDTRGAGLTVKTQSDRVQYYRDDIAELLGIKLNGISFLAGFHWFEWNDEPATGRFDGENSNYGVVNIKDEPYTTLFDGMATTTAMLTYAVENITMPLLTPPSIVTGTVLTGNTVNLSWKPLPGADFYDIIVSPYRSMPEKFTLRFNNITATQYTLPHTLPQGTWWWSVKAVGRGTIQSDFCVLSSFTTGTSMNNPQVCTNPEDLGCFANNITDTFPNPDTALGDGIVMPEETIKDTATQSAMISFTLNSLALQAGLPVSAIVLAGMNMPLVLKGAQTLSIDIYPDVVYTPSGLYRSSTDFVHLRLINNGTILYDSPLPQSLPAYSWSAVGVSVSGTTFTEVTPVFYVDAHASDIPWDQRITFFLDNVILK
jgi:agarase